MSYISLKNVGVDIPIYNANTRSLKRKLFKAATGGVLDRDKSGLVVVRALRDINLELQLGDRVGIVGHNGAGKSSLLRVLSGVYKPTSGQVTIQGHAVSLIDMSLGIDPEATGRENIFIRAALLGMQKKKIKAQLDEIIDFSEIGDFIDMPVRTYSSGMHLRLAFSVATVIRPEILIMDEWLSVGDESFKQKAELRMQELVEATGVMVIASHSQELIKKVCNRVVWLEHGCLRKQGLPYEICEEYFLNQR